MSKYYVHEGQKELNYNALTSIAMAAFEGEERRAWQLVFDELKRDHVFADKSVSLGFLNAPAGKAQHHAYQGGLVVHLLEMLDIAKSLLPIVTLAGTHTLGKTSLAGVEVSYCTVDETLTWENVVRVVLLHDLHKAFQTFSPSLEYIKDSFSSLTTVNMQSLMLVNRFGNYSYTLHPVVVNALEHSEGGWAKNPPYFLTPLAKFCYVLDELSANVVARILEGEVFPKRFSLDEC